MMDSDSPYPLKDISSPSVIKEWEICGLRLRLVTPPERANQAATEGRILQTVDDIMTSASAMVVPVETRPDAIRMLSHTATYLSTELAGRGFVEVAEYIIPPSRRRSDTFYFWAPSPELC